MEGTADAIAEAYGKYAKGATLIFAVSVNHANEIAAKIPGAVVVTGETKDRAAIIERFTAGEIPCIVNCMVFTEGTDIPRVETVIIARPTQSRQPVQPDGGAGLASLSRQGAADADRLRGHHRESIHLYGPVAAGHRHDQRAGRRSRTSWRVAV